MQRLIDGKIRQVRSHRPFHEQPLEEGRALQFDDLLPMIQAPHENRALSKTYLKQALSC